MRKTTVDEVIQAPGEEYDLLRENIKQEIHCAAPGIVREYDSKTQSVTVELALRSVMNGSAVNAPVLKDVPVYFPGGRDGGITFPVQAGDECLVVFADGCIDAWYQSGSVANPISVRRHDLSDGFAFVGFRSRKNALTDVESHYGMNKEQMLNVVYPVGAVYASTKPTEPSELFGGVWERMPEMTMYMWTRVE